MSALSARALTGVSNLSSVVSEVVEPPPQLKIPDETIRPSDAAIKFINNLTPDDYEYVLFTDELVTVSDAGLGGELGQYHVSVAATSRHAIDCYLVHAASEGAIDGVPCGTTITAYVTPRLETIDQQHHEYVSLANHPLDRRTSFKRTDTGYTVEKTVSQGERKETFTRSYDFGTMEGFVTEGANLLLLRLLCTKTLPAYFETLAFDADTNLCQVAYTPLAERRQPIGEAGESVEVIGVQRTLHALTDLPTTWHTYHMRDGHLITRTQVGSPVVMRVTSIPELITPDEFIPKPVFERKPLDWETDPEMQSKFKDRKLELQAEHHRYMRAHPELQCLLADFTQFLLLRQPADPVAFAASYFANFSTKLPTRPSYKSSLADASSNNNGGAGDTNNQ